MKTQKLLVTLFAFLIIYWPSFSLAGSGCCSWHGGVCGCNTSTGSQSCCDGTDSPSCGCQYIPPAPMKTIIPKPIKDTTDYKAFSSSLQSQLDTLKIENNDLKSELDEAKSYGLSTYQYSMELEYSLVVWFTALILYAISMFFVVTKEHETIGEISSIAIMVIFIFIIIQITVSSNKILSTLLTAYSHVIF
ncbi:MAG: hypothetical protein WC823_00230 [Parcubacteria group bacterium]|jgi:hypothetical protein